MSELTALRDHCRRMSHPAGDCRMCGRRHPEISAADRTLFGIIADEIDTYLAGDEDTPPTQTGPDLFGDQT